MLKKYNASLLFALTMAVNLPLQAASNPGYWNDSSKVSVSTGFSKCWRTIDWTSENAIPECEGGMKMVEADSDADGVVDSKDQCSGTIAGVSVDANGCAKDSDNDGVADSNDGCPGTMPGISVNAEGCEKDSDNDGISNSNDKCPGTLAGISVDSKGCARDSDKDGIADSNDKCMNTVAGTKVDATGCDINIDDDNSVWKIFS